MSQHHPIVAVTGSAGAGTTTVRHAFSDIFRRQGIQAQLVKGNSFYRFEQAEMNRLIAQPTQAGRPISYFGPEANHFDKLESLFAQYAKNASGEIRQYLPRPYGFFDDAILQAKYYLGGIFRGQVHPFEKRPEAKLNPLQQVTYFGILNVLLPLQIVTGALMMGVQLFPQGAAWLGGLPLLAPFHSMVAWTFAAFVVGHVYLTTTGPRPLTSIRAMMNGWEEIEVHGEESVGDNPPTRKETP